MTSIGSSTSGMQAFGGYGMRGMHKPDPAQLAEQLFSKLDNGNKGYLQASDISSAVDALGQSGSSQASSGASADQLFSALDSDGDGKLSKSEFSDSLKQLADQLDQQFRQMRMRAGGMPGGEGHGGMPPPQNDAGLSKDELLSRANEVSGSDSKQAEFLNRIADSFDQADADGNGKVTFKEAMTFQHSQQSGNATASSTQSSAANSQTLEQAVSQRILQLIAAYGPQRPEQQSGNSAGSVLASA